MTSGWEVVEIRRDGKPQQEFKLSGGVTSAADLAQDLRNLAKSLERSGRMVEGAILTITLQK